MRNFYTAILKPLGYEIKLGNGEGQEFCGLGTNASGPIFYPPSKLPVALHLSYPWISKTTTMLLLLLAWPRRKQQYAA
jgi:hypothetical protein